MSTEVERAQAAVRAQGMCGALTQDLHELTVCIRPAGHPHPSMMPLAREALHALVRDAIAERPACPHQTNGFMRGYQCADCDATAAIRVLSPVLFRAALVHRRMHRLQPAAADAVHQPDGARRLGGRAHGDRTPRNQQRMSGADMTYGDWHTLPAGSPWRWRDRLARLLGYHCWDCLRL